jgi:hypothetical protein
VPGEFVCHIKVLAEARQLPSVILEGLDDHLFGHIATPKDLADYLLGYR